MCCHPLKLKQLQFKVPFLKTEIVSMLFVWRFGLFLENTMQPIVMLAEDSLPFRNPALRS